jgi:hypothetical protein
VALEGRPSCEFGHHGTLPLLSLSEDMNKWADLYEGVHLHASDDDLGVGHCCESGIPAAEPVKPDDRN